MSQHWYGITKEKKVIPVYSMPNVSGGGSRNVRVTDVRKASTTGFEYDHMGEKVVVTQLLPSVTTITSLLAKPALETWKINKVIDTCYETTSISSLYEYRKIVTQNALSFSKDAADFGTKIHYALETCLQKGGDVTTQPIELRQFLAPTLDWIKAQKLTDIMNEIPVASVANGYAGLVDCIAKDERGELVVIDFKTKKTVEDKKIFHSDEYKMQLAAYAGAVTKDLSKVRCFNLFISSTEPGRFDVVEIDDLEGHFKAFQALCTVFKYKKGI